MIITLDTESTTKNKGHPFTQSNKLCLVGIKTEDETLIYKIEYDDEPYGQQLREIQSIIDRSTLIVGFNLKHDIHWLRRYGIKFDDVRVWDVQLAYFAMSGQTKPYPSLNQVSADYSHGQKIDVIKEQYWEKGIDSTEIPLDIFTAYLKQDLELPYLCYLTQMELLKDKPKLHTCIRMMNLDMLVLEEMEFNGTILDVLQCNEQSKLATEKVLELDSQLSHLVGTDRLNWNSGYHVSAVLYGGSINVVDRELVKTTLKSGRVSERFRNVEKQLSFTRLVEPLKGSNLDKEGFWSTSADTLRELKAVGKAKQIIALVLERHEIAKLNNTYYKGLPKLIKEMEWAENTIHGNLNQCVAVTGRLSSTKPNMQNNPAIVDKLFRSRYD